MIFLVFVIYVEVQEAKGVGKLKNHSDVERRFPIFHFHQR